MRKPFKITEHFLNNLVNRVLNEDEQDEWVKVSPEQYLDIMKYASYNAKGVSRLPQYRDKKIWITGDLNVKKLPINSLEGIGYVEGNLNISNTDIRDISFINVKGRTSDYGSGVAKIRQQRIRQAKLSDAQERRESNEWSEDSDNDLGLRARAVLKYIVYSNRNVVIKNEDDNDRLVELKEQLESLLEKEKQYDEQGKDLTDIFADIAATEVEIEKINNKMDVYNLIPMEHDFYKMSAFEVVGNDDFENNQYAVGTEYEVEQSCREYLEEQFYDGPEYYFSESFLEYHIDEERVLEYFREHYEYDVESNPDIYFNEDDFELSSEQEKRKEELENEIQEWEEKQKNLESEIEEPEEYSRMYDQIQNHIDSLQEEIDDMEPDREPTQDMINDRVDGLLYEVKENLIDYMKDFGLKISDYIDEDGAIQDIINNDGYGNILNGYDGNYDIVSIDDKTFVVMRIG